MSAFFALQASRHIVVENLFKKIDHATDVQENENHAAVKIQSVARMRQQRNIYTSTRRAVIDMQRVFRGYCGRKKALRTRITQIEAYNRAVFHHFASVIQARFRGFYTRKYISDFYARKRYIAQVVDVSEAVRADAQRAFDEQQKEHEAAVRRSQLGEYGQVTGKMHHLLSTASISGVYRPLLSKDGMQTVFGTSIEDDLHEIARRRKFKPDLPQKQQPLSDSAAGVLTAVSKNDNNNNNSVPRTSSNSPERLSQNLAQTKKVLKFPHEKLLQNSVTYDFEHQEQLLQRSVERAITNSIHEKPFITKKPDPPKMPRPIAVETPYVGKPAIIRR